MAALCVIGTATAALVITLRANSVNATLVGTSAPLFIPISGPGTSAAVSQGSTSPGLSAARPNAASNAAAGAAAPTIVVATTRHAGAAARWLPTARPGPGNRRGRLARPGPRSAAHCPGGGAGPTSKAAVTDAQARELAVDDAMLAAGIPSATITVAAVQIGQNGYFPYNPGQAIKPSATGTVTVVSSDPVQLATAADAAEKAGGTGISSYTAFGFEAGTPSSGDIATALHDATGTAHDQAVLAASAAGVRLGKVAGLTTSPPSLCYGAGGERLVVTVTINYSLTS